MPNLDSIPIRKYQPLWAYHEYYDNLPINDVETQLFIVNSQVDLNQTLIEDAVGNAGSLANRLNQSLLASGALKTAAVDTALHSIASHTDGGGYVRMSSSERSKLSLIDVEATNLSIEVDTISATISWPDADTVFRLVDSDTIEWRVESGEVLADTTFAKTLINIPSYDITPVMVSGDTLFKTTSSDTPYKSGTLRVFINGLRMTKTATVGGYTYSETNPSIGTFTLSPALSVGDRLRIDFDQPIS